MPIEGITIGADIEVFLFDEENNHFKSVVGLIGGSKEYPRPVISKGYGLQEDNVLLEFTIPVAKTKQQFIKIINTIKNVLPEFTIPYTPKYLASAHFPESELRSPEAKMFGCSPDFNAWTLKENKSPKCGSNTLRTSGFHIHCGYKNPNPVDSIAFIRAFDLFVGIPSLFIDTDTERRQLYGKAGAHRIKPYGVEARILSGYFLDSDDLMEFVYDGTMKSIQFVNEGKVISKEHGKVIQEAINTNNLDLAAQLVTEYQLSTQGVLCKA